MTQVRVYFTDGWERVFVGDKCVYDGHGLCTSQMDDLVEALGGKIVQRTEIPDPDDFEDQAPPP